MFFFLFGYLHCVEIDPAVVANGIVQLFSKANKKMIFF